ncbi:hypothetical protein HYFRA_00005058 [Hymenoscyphus fraxineus]|uniref:Uncharacterized protein n=1 Tax=Hymenoscyphus fraxineus TaxID=746836 RepID=A0A9N9PEQ9_9HELO|nr:hypothetical protein HYFRA_00005058 [Hymenoscyphus fraxineus]
MAPEEMLIAARHAAECCDGAKYELRYRDGRVGVVGGYLDDGASFDGAGRWYGSGSGSVKMPHPYSLVGADQRREVERNLTMTEASPIGLVRVPLHSWTEVASVGQQHLHPIKRIRPIIVSAHKATNREEASAKTGKRPASTICSGHDFKLTLSKLYCTSPQYIILNPIMTILEWQCYARHLWQSGENFFVASACSTITASFLTKYSGISSAPEQYMFIHRYRRKHKQSISPNSCQNSLDANTLVSIAPMGIESVPH